MAIDNLTYPEAHNLAHAEKAFYPVRIPVSHWQLRHYISTPERDILYYASGHDIYCLNTATKKRKHIATLPFEARCTASGYGWVCVGGADDGHFAAIKLDGSAPRTLDVDSALPIDQQWRRGADNANIRRAASVKVERIGEEIVNSISIHRIQDEEAHLDDIVAVLTNNDKTVRVYSLPSGTETTVLDLPFAMNHATVSPDGQTLIAVGDVNQAYFYQREIQDTPPQIHKPHNRLTSASIEWTLVTVVNLYISEPPSTVGYFTTAWSPSGQLVAVGAEGGYITVLDMEILMSPDFEVQDQAIVATVPSSRPDIPDLHPGAIRSMMFSPEPWDLLIWAEDQGRVCIGDLRTGLKSRQIVYLDPKDESLRRVSYEDVPGDDLIASAVPTSPRDIDDLEADFIRRYRQAPDNATAVNFATEYIEARRRQRQQRQDAANSRQQTAELESALLDDDPRGLTAREQQILESLRTTRQREEARSRGETPRSVNYTTPDLFRDTGSSRSAAATPNTSNSSARPISEMLSSVPDSFPELSRTSAASPRSTSSHGPESRSTLPPLSTLRDLGGINQRNSTGLVRLSDGSRLPRRRASVILSPPGTDSSALTNHGDSGGSSTVTSQAQRIAAAAEEQENPWRTIEEHMTLARGPLFESSGAGAGVRAQAASPSTRLTESELQAELAAERARARRLASQRERWRSTLFLRGSDALTDAGRVALGYDSPTATSGASSRLTTTAVPQGGEGLLRRIQARGGYSGREIGVRTAGLAMSADGRTLWAACEEGIFEIEIQVRGRLFWPAVEPR